MAVANASSVSAMLARIRTNLELAPTALSDVALDTIEAVQQSAQSLAGQEYQVGFDLPQFQANIAEPGPLVLTAPGDGHVGILDVGRMGTVEDFERIGGSQGQWPFLFHGHTRDRKHVWRDIVYPHPENREEVAQARRAVWGDKTPQWFLLNDGAHGDGVFPDTPATHFIDNATSAPTVLARIKSRFSMLLRSR